MLKKILIMGLPGAGKTTLARQLAPRLNAVHFNADDVRANVNRDLGFSEPDRIEHARRMGWLCDQVVKVGCFAIADFICPTPATREAFASGGNTFVIWVDRIQTSAFEDTNRMFVPPERFDLRVTAKGSPEYWAEQAMTQLRPIFDAKKPTALFIGRYQPFHDGHRALIIEGLKRIGQACIAVRNTQGIDDTRTPSTSSMCARGSSTHCANSKAVSSWFRCPISPTFSMDATSATRSSASTLIFRLKTSPRPGFEGNHLGELISWQPCHERRRRVGRHGDLTGSRSLFGMIAKYDRPGPSRLPTYSFNRSVVACVL
jgi:adenylylsulfate kinase